MKPRLLISALSSLIFLCGCVPDTSERHVLRNSAPDSISFVQVMALNLRQCPSIQCEILSVLHAGDKVTVLSEQNGWYQISRPATGKTGWLAARYIAGQPPKKKSKPRLSSHKQKPAMPVEEFGSASDSSSPPVVEESFAPLQTGTSQPELQQLNPPPPVLEEFAQ